MTREELTKQIGFVSLRVYEIADILWNQAHDNAYHGKSYDLKSKYHELQYKMRELDKLMEQWRKP